MIFSLKLYFKTNALKTENKSFKSMRKACELENLYYYFSVDDGNKCRYEIYISNLNYVLVN